MRGWQNLAFPMAVPFFLLGCPTDEALGDAPRVVVSIQPVHSLVAGVMAGVAAPVLLGRGASSPHTHTLRPSDAAALERADIVFWVGPVLETFLQTPVRVLARTAHIVELGDDAELEFPTRKSGAMGDSGIDWHIWLDPRNARRIVRRAVSVLGRRDAPNAERYRANGVRLTRRLDALEAELRAELAPVRAVPYVVFHDAYRHFEHRFDTTAVGAISASSARPPGAKRLAEIRDMSRAGRMACLFREPQFNPALVAALVAGTPVKTGVLDPLGNDLEPGPEAYFVVMRRLAQSLKSCLSSNP